MKRRVRRWREAGSLPVHLEEMRKRLASLETEYELLFGGISVYLMASGLDKPERVINPMFVAKLELLQGTASVVITQREMLSKEMNAYWEDPREGEDTDATNDATTSDA